MDLFFFNTDKKQSFKKRKVNIKKFIDLNSVDVFNSIIVNEC